MDWKGKNLAEGQFQRCDLKGADLTESICTYASFTGANLEGAKVNDADMRKCKYDLAEFITAGWLQGAKLGEVNWSLTLNLTLTLIGAVHGRPAAASGAPSRERGSAC